MPEPRRVAIVLVHLDTLTEGLGLMKHGEITHAATDRFREGGNVFLAGDWTRGGAPPAAALVREAGEIARLAVLPPGLMVVEAWTQRDIATVFLRVEGASLPPVMLGQAVPRYVVVVEEVPQPAGLKPERHGRLAPAGI